MSDGKYTHTVPARRNGWLFIGVIGFLAVADLLVWAVLWDLPRPDPVVAMISPAPPQPDPLPTPVFQAPAATPSPVR